MKYHQIVTSILDQDLYKFTMMNAVIKRFSNAIVKYEFILRGDTEFPEGFGAELREQVQSLSDVTLTEWEYEKFQEKCGSYLDPTFFTFLRGFRFKPGQIGIIQKDGALHISIEGLWFDTILWEVILMAIISELYFLMTNQPAEEEFLREKKLSKKAQFFNMNGMNFADFGTRRRHSLANQREVVEYFKEHCRNTFVGTSNVLLALENDLTPIGTHAHEWFMFMGAKYGYKMANEKGLEHWSEVYKGHLGIALSDTFTTEIFFRSFDVYYAKLFDGVRHDSGDPIDFGNRVIEHYKSLGIDPTAKTIVFSDGLNLEICEKIIKAFRGKIRMSFGIGTFFTNDVGVKALNMVIKMLKAKPSNMGWEDTIKLSDNPIKHTGKESEIIIAKSTLHLMN